MLIQKDINYIFNKNFLFDEYILGQGYGNASRLKMGFFNGSHNGCGWIASFNAIKMLGTTVHPSKIIKKFENLNPLRLGFLGIHPLTIIAFFHTGGYKVRLTFNPNKFDETAKKNKANIVFYLYNIRGHFFSFNWDDEIFKAYNVFNNQKSIRTFSSIKTYLRKKGWFYLLISISDKKVLD